MLARLLLVVLTAIIFHCRNRVRVGDGGVITAAAAGRDSSLQRRTLASRTDRRVPSSNSQHLAHSRVLRPGHGRTR